MKMKTALTIAGSDCSGGAGIQADLKTMTMNGVYAMSAITALTAQNTTGVRGVQEATPEFLAQQIDAVFEDIRPDAVKIGMVSSSELIQAIADRLKYHKAENIVVDTVMVATSGARLISEDAIDTLKEYLIPLATVVTPNIPEAEVLAAMSIRDEENMVEAAKKIGDTYHCAVLLKGGHSINDANDLCIKMVHTVGLRANASTIRTHTVRGVLCHLQLPPTSQKAMILERLYRERKNISLLHLPICSIWGKDPDL